MEFFLFFFFEVSPKSFHQVAEVTSQKSRLSISGWFHGKPFPRPQLIKDPLPPFHTPTESKIDLDNWIGREYRKLSTIGKVKKKFVQESSIELHEFLRRDKYDALFKELSEQKWLTVGPPNKIHYSRLDTLTGESNLAEFQKFLISQEFSEFIASITGLSPTTVNMETRRFQHRDYTLGHDHDPEIEKSGLDVTFCLVPVRSKWTTTMGGSTHYLVAGENEELVTVFPRENALSLVYRTGGGIVRFVKYLNHNVPGPRYDFNLVYRVEEEGDDDDEE